MSAVHRERQLVYSLSEIIAIDGWLRDRAAGYPSLKKFEGGADMPKPRPFGLYADLMVVPESREAWEQRHYANYRQP
jgi:hypothetical protein